jgi:hypothetical protein
MEDNTTRATARLPGLDIEIIHRRSLNDEAEQISINLQAMPSFEAFGRLNQCHFQEQCHARWLGLVPISPQDRFSAGG